jgi:DNA-binding NtrC family response regulator
MRSVRVRSVLGVEAPDGPVVAIADGEALYRWFARECLRDAGYRVLLFARASQMLTYLADHQAAVVLVDAQTLGDEKIDPGTVRVDGAEVVILGSDQAGRFNGGLPDRMAQKPADRDSLLALVKSVAPEADVNERANGAPR